MKNIVIQSQCMNCEVKKQIDILKSTPPPISPSNPFYFLIELINKQKSVKYKLPTEKIDFTLGTMSKEVSAVDTIIANSKNHGTIEYLFTKWGNNLDQINQLFSNVDQQNQKDEYTRRIYFYYWNLLVSVQKWRELKLTEPTRAVLDKFEDLLTSAVQQLHFIPEDSSANYAVQTKIYSVNTPYSGSYKLAVYNYKSNDSEVLSGFVNNIPHNFTKSSDSKWYLGESIKLDESEQTIVMPGLARREKSYPGFKLSTTAGTSKCEVVNVGKTDNEIDYELSLGYLTLSNRLVDVQLLETNQEFPQGLIKPIYPEVIKDISNPFSYRLNFKYKPGTYADSAFIKICVEGAHNFPTTFELQDIKVIEKYPDYLIFLVKDNSLTAQQNYNLQFVALNQTAYLVRVSGTASPFVLGFNSRFDGQWGMREVSSDTASSYFTGKQKTYLDGQVTEYERQDKHLLSGIVFKKGVIKSPDIALNAYGNGWLVNNLNKNEATYLIEYRPQNVLYKTASVSILSLIGLILMYARFYLIKK